MSLLSRTRADRARFWHSLIGQWQSSGLTQAEFCRRREIRVEDPDEYCLLVGQLQ